jgi:hypothetical protein
MPAEPLSDELLDELRDRLEDPRPINGHATARALLATIDALRAPVDGYERLIASVPALSGVEIDVKYAEPTTTPSPSPADDDPYAGCAAYSEHGACACSAGEFGIRCRMGESYAPEPSPAATGERVEPISEEEVDGLARRFHSVYESWAPSFGWDTQEASQVSWDDLPSNQRHLMLTVVREVVAPIARERDTLRAKAAPEPSSAVAEESLIASYVAMAEDSTARAEAAEERVRVLTALAERWDRGFDA